MGPYPHDAPAAQVTAANPMGTVVDEVVHVALAVDGDRLGAMARHRGKTHGAEEIVEEDANDGPLSARCPGRPGHRRQPDGHGRVRVRRM
jgi:hypothetical protein